MSMNIARKPAMPQRMEASDKPLVRKDELERAEASLRTYVMSEDELIAAQARCDRRGNWNKTPSYDPRHPRRRS